MQETKNPLIFLIEDSVVYKDLIAGYLKAKKFSKLKVFKNGEECLRHINEDPDIIILDYSSEGINGLEFMLKIEREHPDIDFIFLSAQNKVEIAVKIMKLGAADYIIKNDQAPKNLVESIERLKNASKRDKQRKGFKVGVLGFFILLFLIIMIITFVSIFFDLSI
ncbi:response regulator [Draconibacterium sp. IB214405]|uniref:response regulator n=1 Tax=Draconibacterium sp. IB214405 TaxID=3097352 RepID=UPI002A0F1C12|nr:response regulator [Draconibacterium sp. IB214405]MDX8338060.1 response regulator [Draconibacterium sp. IB214405]